MTSSNKRNVIGVEEAYPKWADIPGYAGYRASVDGEIINASNGRIKRQRPAYNGSLQVHLGKSTRMVHDLVARAHYGRPPCRGYSVKHRNGDLSDNQIENLMWSGRSRGRQQRPRLAVAVQDEYNRILEERNSLIELMQT